MIISRLFIVVFAVLINISTHAGERTEDYPDLLKYYPVKEIRSDFVIMLDMSASMAKFWPQVKSALGKFVGTIPDGDYVTVWGFDSSARRLIIPRVLNEKTKQDMIAEINALPEPTGNSTDLFRAVDAAIDELSIRAKNELKFAFFFTDFVNSPPAGSKWQDNTDFLNDKYRKMIVEAGKTLEVHAIQLPLSPKAGRDFNAFSDVFGKSVIRFMFDVKSLVEWYINKKEDVQRIKLSLAVQDNFRKAFNIKSIEASGGSFVVKMANRLKLPASIESASLTTKEQGISTAKIEGVKIKPGSDFEITIPFNGDMKQLGSFLSEPHKISVESLVINFAPEHPGQLTSLGIGSPAAWEGTFGESIYYYTGISVWLIIIPVLVIGVVILGFILKKKLRKPPEPEPIPEPEPEPEPEEKFVSPKYRVSIKLNGEVQSLKKDVFEIGEKVSLSPELLRDANPKMADFTIYINPASLAEAPEKQGNGLYISYEAHPSFTASYIRNDEPVKEQMVRGRNILAEQVIFEKEYKMSATYMNKFRNDNYLEIKLEMME